MSSPIHSKITKAHAEIRVGVAAVDIQVLGRTYYISTDEARQLRDQLISAIEDAIRLESPSLQDAYRTAGCNTAKAEGLSSGDAALIDILVANGFSRERAKKTTAAWKLIELKSKSFRPGYAADLNKGEAGAH